MVTREGRSRISTLKSLADCLGDEKAGAACRSGRGSFDRGDLKEAAMAGQLLNGATIKFVLPGLPILLRDS